MNLVLLSTDLMMISRVDGAARRFQLSTVTATNQQAAMEAAEAAKCYALFVDLQVTGIKINELVTAIRDVSSKATILAYGPHVHEDKLAAAREAGCDQVLSRGQFDRELNELIAEIARRL